jgi:hypothetical protein
MIWHSVASQNASWLRPAFRIALLCCVVAGAAGCPPVDGAGGGAISSVPANASYRVTLSGTTWSGNTGVPMETTSYTAVENFQLTGTLLVSPTRDVTGVNYNNGINPRDIGLFVGNPTAQPRAGSIWFATNSLVYVDAGVGGATQQAGIDIAFVRLDGQRGRLEIDVHGDYQGLPAARALQLNTFNTRSSLFTSDAFQVLTGYMNLDFGAGGSTVQGELMFIGAGLLYPGSSAITANLSGTRN